MLYPSTSPSLCSAIVCCLADKTSLESYATPPASRLRMWVGLLVYPLNMKNAVISQD
jgi:hypothetical protein